MKPHVASASVLSDPGNQIIPDPWRGVSSIMELAALMKAYTKDVLTTAVANAEDFAGYDALLPQLGL